MKMKDDGVILSASDLIGHLNCACLTKLDLDVALGNLVVSQEL